MIWVGEKTSVKKNPELKKLTFGTLVNDGNDGGLVVLSVEDIARQADVLAVVGDAKVTNG